MNNGAIVKRGVRNLTRDCLELVSTLRRHPFPLEQQMPSVGIEQKVDGLVGNMRYPFKLLLLLI